MKSVLWQGSTMRKRTTTWWKWTEHSSRSAVSQQRTRYSPPERTASRWKPKEGSGTFAAEATTAPIIKWSCSSPWKLHLPHPLPLPPLLLSWLLSLGPSSLPSHQSLSEINAPFIAPILRPNTLISLFDAFSSFVLLFFFYARLNDNNMSDLIWTVRLMFVDNTIIR